MPFSGSCWVRPRPLNILGQVALCMIKWPINLWQWLVGAGGGGLNGPSTCRVLSNKTWGPRRVRSLTGVEEPKFHGLIQKSCIFKRWFGKGWDGSNRKEVFAAGWIDMSSFAPIWMFFLMMLEILFFCMTKVLSMVRELLPKLLFSC